MVSLYKEDIVSLFEGKGKTKHRGHTHQNPKKPLVSLLWHSVLLCLASSLVTGQAGSDE